MHYSFSIALKYLRSKKRSGFISRVALIAVAGTFVGVATLIIVLSLMNGFENELRSRIVGFNTHVLVFARTPGAWAAIDTVETKINEIPEVLHISRFVRGESIIYYELIPGVKVKTKGVIVKGVNMEEERNVSTVIDSITPRIKTFESESLDGGNYMPGIVLGRDLALDMHVSLGEVVTLISAPAELKVGKINPRTRDFRVVGFFKTGVYEFDSRFAYIDIK
ncbi:hypothetical protein DRQ05_02455, partial [bacterium]